MSPQWREHSAALAEYQAAAQWYETRRPGWGDVFMDAVDAAIDSICDSSIEWGFYRGRRSTPQLYSRSVRGFPFRIIYVRVDDVVFVLAYAHERRRPDYWKPRTTE